ncbi:hypothetical protein lerEdw1_015178 [Lerista edwardsae]|nr:hypothetical protein lerEdw1_015178 [Lerista edwardsae]
MGQTGLAKSSRNVPLSLLSLFVVLLQLASGRELTFVLLLYRHGDRSPLRNYPQGLHNESEWPQGFGHLTTVGWLFKDMNVVATKPQLKITRQDMYD